MIQTAINLIKQRPLLGHGLNTFRSFPGSFGTWSHNNYLELWVSGGLLPVVIYYINYIYSLVKLKSKTSTPMGGLFFSLMLYFFIHDAVSVTYVSRYAGIVLGFIAAYLVVERNSDHRENNI